MEGVDGSVGTIVWVRRRNGSWWPGRILGQDELSASHLMSPRSGTPVKLLGREDASVDWYNLEKSKRVKAFRCGEFDACIERAEASQGIAIKKREKYARREDAILHALELEKQQMELKHQSTSNDMNIRTSSARKRELSNFSSSYDYVRDDDPESPSKFANHKSPMFSEKATLSHKEGDNLYVPKGSKSKQTGWTEHNPETLPRMRELQEFGLRIAPPKKKLSPSIWETSFKPVNNHVSVHSDAGHMMGSTNHAGGSKSYVAVKRKRLQVGGSEVSPLKKRDRRRPLVQVLQSSAKLPISHSFQSGYDSGANSIEERDHIGAMCQEKRSTCVYLPADSNDSMDTGEYRGEQMAVTGAQLRTGDYLDHSDAQAEDYTSSATTEETESDSSETESSETDADVNGLTDTSHMLLPGSTNCDPPVVHITENFRDLDDGEKPHVDYTSLVHPQDRMTEASADAGVSKWHMKGKRNIRPWPKRPTDSSYIKGTTYESRDQKTAGRSLFHKKEASHYDGDTLEGEDPSYLMRYGNKRYSFALQAAKDGRRTHNSFNDSDSDSHLPSPSRPGADGLSSHARSGYWDDADECYNPVYHGHYREQMGTMLIDVELKVQAASYQGEHVPLVSLMSRLNGKAIIGHPVQIEILEDGSTGPLVTKYDADLEESNVRSAVWKTARRSVMHRVPRNPAASDLLQDSDPESKPSYFDHPSRLVKKSGSHSRLPSVPGRYQKKLPKKASASLSQKTRRLSALAEENSSAKRARCGLLNGLIKPDGAAPLVTCVPVKVVFSRILEAVGRPPSASAHRARMASPASRAPS